MQILEEPLLEVAPVTVKAGGDYELVRDKPFLVYAAMRAIREVNDGLGQPTSFVEGSLTLPYHQLTSHAKNANNQLQVEAFLEGFAEERAGEDGDLTVFMVAEDLVDSQGDSVASATQRDLGISVVSAYDLLQGPDGQKIPLPQRSDAIDMMISSIMSEEPDQRLRDATRQLVKAEYEKLLLV